MADQSVADPNDESTDGARSTAGQGDRARRWSRLLDMLADKGRLSVIEAASVLAVSEATIRRDFTELARQQLVARTHGGVVATSVAYDLPVRYRAAAKQADIEGIAAVAAQQVEPGAIVGFNGGTTTSATARRLAADIENAPRTAEPALTLVTNALNIASEMVLRPHIRTVSVGGVARPQSYEVTGPLAALVIDNLWLDVLFLGIDGLNARDGASCQHVGEAGINSRMTERASRVIAIGTGNKIGHQAFARICGIDRIDVLITDVSAPKEEVAAVRSAGVDVRIA